jgi:hypothetical protein
LAHPIGDALVVIEAGELAEHPLRKLFEGGSRPSPSMFEDRPEDASRLIRDSLTPR